MKTNPIQVSQRDSSHAPLNPMLSIVLAGLAIITLQSSCSPIVLGDKSPVVACQEVKATDACNPIIFIHGTMGSHMVDSKTGLSAWGRFSRHDANGESPESLRRLALPMERGRPLHQLKDSTRAVGYLDNIDLKLMGMVDVVAPVYGRTTERFGDICTNSGAAGKRECGRHLDFHYDWRRSFDENARLLAAFIKSTKRELVANHGFPEDMKFNVVAHSQGALLFKYFLRYGDGSLPADGSLPELTWAGAQYAEDVVYIGVPNAGVGPTLDFLTNGHQAKRVLPFYEPAVVGTMPAVYQMLPRARDGVLIDPESGRYLDPLDYDLWVEREWGLANPAQDRVLRVLLPDVSGAAERRAIALDHLRKCLTKAKQVQAALDRPAKLPRHIHRTLCISDTVDTKAAYLAAPRNLKLTKTLRGDGTVAVYSALRHMDSGADAHYFEGDHLEIVTAQEVNRCINKVFESRAAARANMSSPRLFASNP